MLKTNLLKHLDRVDVDHQAALGPCSAFVQLLIVEQRLQQALSRGNSFGLDEDLPPKVFA